MTSLRFHIDLATATPRHVIRASVDSKSSELWNRPMPMSTFDEADEESRAAASASISVKDITWDLTDDAVEAAIGLVR